jgi:hypothetical protein
MFKSSIAAKAYGKAFPSAHVERHWRAVRMSASLFLALALCLLTAGCFESKVVTSRVNDPDGSKRPTKMSGVFYALPRTVVKANVPIVRTDKEPGEFYAFTPCFFPNENYLKVKSTEFGVDTPKIDFATLPVPDPKQIFLIKTQGGMFETRSLELELTESGVFVKATGETTNEAIDIVTGSIKTGVGLIAKASSTGLFANKVVPPENVLESKQLACRSHLIATWATYLSDAKRALQQAHTADEKTQATQVLAKLTAARPEILDDNRVDAFKNEYEKAEEAFKTIQSLEKRRHNDVLDTTTTPASVHLDTFKLMLDELDKSITTLKESNFIGTKSDLTWNASFKLNPEKSDPNDSANIPRMSIDLFTLSKQYGVCEVLANTQSNQGVPLVPKFKIEKECSADNPNCKPDEQNRVDCKGKKVWLEIAPGENGEGAPGGTQFADVIKGASLNPNGHRGFYYRIPGRAIGFVRKETAEANSDELARAPLSIAQFGEVVSLPASTGGRRTKYTLALYEASGGLKNFVMGSDSLVKQKNIDDLTDAASTAIEAKGERKKAKAPADELQQLERQRKILEEKKKIRDLEKDLDTKGLGTIP